MARRYAADHVGPERGPLIRVFAKSSLARSGSLPMPCVTCTKQASSGSPFKSVMTSLLLRNETSPPEQPGGLHLPLGLLWSVTVAASSLFRLEAGKRDEEAIVCHSGGRSKPAHCGGPPHSRFLSQAPRRPPRIRPRQHSTDCRAALVRAGR